MSSSAVTFLNPSPTCLTLTPSSFLPSIEGFTSFSARTEPHPATFCSGSSSPPASPHQPPRWRNFRKQTILYKSYWEVFIYTALPNLWINCSTLRISRSLRGSNCIQQATRASPSYLFISNLPLPPSPCPPMQSMAAAISLSLFNPSPTMKTPTSKPTKPATLLIPHPHNILDLLHSSDSGISIAAASAAAFSLPVFILPPEALSAGGEFGILEGRTLALVHPLVMGSLFFYTLWTGYLGWQWRRVRTIQDEINDFKKQVKSPAPAATASGLVGAYQEPVPMPQESPSPVELNILKLTEERKQLLKGGYRDRHFNAGSILLGFGVLESVGGALNTWLRTGKLFPGPHLFAGAGITVLWALAAALVPLMQKGNETARNLHILLNTLNVLLFLSQIPTGIEIVLKVFEFTEWP